MEFCDHSWNSFNLSHNCTKFVCFLPPVCRKSAFSDFSAKRCKCKSEKKDSHRTLRNGHAKVMEMFLIKTVGALKPMRNSPKIPVHVYISS